MEQALVKQSEQRLPQELDALDAGAEQRREDADTIALDQQKVGRLSRMDALQQQAMAQATQARAKQRRGQIVAALERCRKGHYGECQACGEMIAVGRLQADPAVLLCIDCAEKRG